MTFLFLACLSCPVIFWLFTLIFMKDILALIHSCYFGWVNRPLTWTGAKGSFFFFVDFWKIYMERNCIYLKKFSIFFGKYSIIHLQWNFSGGGRGRERNLIIITKLQYNWFFIIIILIISGLGCNYYLLNMFKLVKILAIGTEHNL